MIRNVGNVDRLTRLVVSVALVLLASVVKFDTWGGILLLVVAAVLAITAFTGSCPLYRVLNINTYRKNRSKS